MGLRVFSISVLLLVAYSGCSSTFIVRSDPGQADVFFVDSRTGDRKPLGKTPLEMPMGDLRKTVGEATLAGEFFTVEIDKKDFIPEKLTVPASRFGTLVTAIDAKLKPGDAPKEKLLAKEILDHLFLAQKLALAKEFERSQIELDKILSQAPEFARALSMRASIYFVQKNYAESLKWYEAALKADPQMEDAVQMSAKARLLSGGGKEPVRAPATEPVAADPAKGKQP